MAEAHESVAEVDENANEKGRRRRFGRRKEEPSREVRSETEWVDTLVAHPEGEDEPLAGSPFAAGEDESEPEPVTAPLAEVHDHGTAHGDGTLPEEATPVGDEVVIREKQLYRPAKLALENQVRSSHAHRGDRDAFYEKSWNRRQGESMEEIHNYIDNVLGTEHEPSRRRERLTRAGLAPRTRQDAAAVHVEGLEGDILLAFTFPRQEFRSARVVYETEGGYVVEVSRAVGNDETRIETQYYTVSRVGEVGHVLDKMRAREAERRASEMAALAPEPISDSFSRAPTPHVQEPIAEPPTPEDVGAPGPVEEPQVAEVPPQEPAPDITESEGKKGFGMFKRKGDASPEPVQPEAPADGGDEAAKKKGLGGLFKRKKGDGTDDAPTGEGGTEAENQA